MDRTKEKVLKHLRRHFQCVIHQIRKTRELLGFITERKRITSFLKALDERIDKGFFYIKLY